MVNAIIIPDVHGRNFWKDAVVQYKNTGALIIFLGDYMDPYPSEKIRFDQAYENFKDIIEFKKNDPEHVILLIGNHDLHYITNSDKCRSSRYDYLHNFEICELFKQNLGLFKLMHVLDTASGKKYVFSHAGITRNWLDKYSKNLGIDRGNDISELYTAKFSDVIGSLKINELFADDKTREDVITALSAISYRRGGYDEFGSMIWEDVLAFITQKTEEDVIQIFGHTQLKDVPINRNGLWYDLDVRRGFMIKDCEVCELDGTVVPVTSMPEIF